jgi:flagellin
MIINHNIPALNAYRNLSMNQTSQSKSMEKLSSGLRINRAADDAAGLAISETMKAQINGLNQASRNSQDAISLLQTAEGALTETHSILQRMRELSVQSANDTYTSNDRQEIQKEVDQMKSEIDRISNTTTFNNKNLLDGTAAALTSTDNNSTKVFLRGALQNAGGNYKLSITANAGKAQVQKSDLFKQNHGGDSIQNLSVDSNSGIQHVSAVDIAKGSYQVQTVDTKGPAADTTMAANVAQSFRKNTGETISTVAATRQSGAATSVNASVLAEVVNAKSGAVAGSYSNVTIKLSWYEADKSGNYLNSAGVFAATGNAKLQTKTVTINTTAAQTTNLGKDLQLTFKANSMAVVIGDKATVNIKASAIVASGSLDTVNVNYDSSAKVGAMTPFRSQSVVNWAFSNDSVDNKTVSFNNFTIGASGKASSGKISVSFGGLQSSNPVTGDTKFDFQDGLGKVASLDTKLSNIDKFYDASGKFLLDDAQPLTLVEGDGTKTSIQIYGTDTIKDVQDKLNSAIGGGLGQNKLVAPADQGKFVSFVTSAANSGPEAVAGTFVIRSAKAGSDGQINIVGNEQLINAMSLTDIQSATESQFTVSVSDAHDPNKVIAQDVKIQGNTLIGVIDQNVDVKFDSNADIKVAWNDKTKALDLAGDQANPYTSFVHLVNNSQVFQIGANQDQNMGAAIGNMNSDALGVKNVIVTDRDSAGRAITQIDNAISRVSSQRSSLGAVQNRLEHTINNLGVASENLTAASSRITDVDMASEMMTFSKLNIMSQAATAMLAQANQQPQLVLQLLGR